MTIHIGPSGWNYREWRQGFYQGVPQRRWLPLCTETFTGVEVNGTFYRLPKPETLEKWRATAPATGFAYAIKGWRMVTHQKKLRDPHDYVPRVREALAPLMDRVGVVLWQLPGKLEKDMDRLATFAGALAAWPEVRHAVEFRHESWFDDDVADFLGERGLANVISDAADWPCWVRATTDLVYIRLHGHDVTYHSAYGEDGLRPWADRIRQWHDEGRTVHVYFDNTDAGAAPDDARLLMRLLGVEAPAPEGNNK